MRVGIWTECGPTMLVIDCNGLWWIDTATQEHGPLWNAATPCTVKWFDTGVTETIVYGTHKQRKRDEQPRNVVPIGKGRKDG